VSEDDDVIETFTPELVGLSPANGYGDPARAREAAAGLDLQQVEDLQAERRERARRRARRRLNAEERGELVLPEPVNLRAFLDEPDPPVQWRVSGWWPANGRVILAAARKTGKTTLVGNVVRSLADGVPFLGAGLVAPAQGSVAVVDNEMSPGMLRRWYRDLAIGNPERVTVWTMRGQGSAFDIVDEDVRALWAARLRALPDGTATLILDCLSPALGALGLTESNEDVNRFLVAFDALLVEAGIGDALIAHHMGHVEERSRGASRLRDWPEAEWRYVRERDDKHDREVDHGARIISAYGRDVDHRESRLTYDPITRLLGLVGGDRRQHALSQHTPVVAEIVRAEPGIQTNALKDRLTQRTGVVRAETLTGAIVQAEAEGVITIERGGRGKPNHHLPAPVGGADAG
jgi:hypothetical protein